MDIAASHAGEDLVYGSPFYQDLLKLNPSRATAQPHTKSRTAQHNPTNVKSHSTLPYTTVCHKTYAQVLSGLEDTDITPGEEEEFSQEELHRPTIMKAPHNSSKFFKHSDLKTNKSFTNQTGTNSVNETRHNIPRTPESHITYTDGHSQKNKIDWAHIWARFLAVAQKFFGSYNTNGSFLHALFNVWEDILDLVSTCFTNYGS